MNLSPKANRPFDVRYALALLCLGTLPVGCAVQTGPGGQGEESTDDSLGLVGGKQAAASQFPATVRIAGGCTAARVGPRHLLIAAHCVQDHASNQLRWDYQPGSVIEYTNAPKTDPATAYGQGTIAKTSVHPAWTQHWTNWTVNVLGEEVPPDVAVIELTQDLIGVQEASVDMRPVRLGETLTIMGYGCEAGVYGHKDYTANKLKFQTTYALPASATLHEGSHLWGAEDPRFERLDASYVITPGGGRSVAEASLCPGDSGGPVYRDEGTEKTIVGVNAYYSFRPTSDDPAGKSVTNWHTRLDDDSRFEVGRWLKGLGVRVVETPEPPVALGEVVCPDGYGLYQVGEEGGVMCVDDAGKNAYGPFTRTMIADCIRFGGGEDACNSLRWGTAFALDLRGEALCPRGASFDYGVRYCAEGVDAFGPFPPAIVTACEKEGGGPACKTARMNVDFLRFLQKSVAQGSP
jgi:hypothetical protein